MESDGMVRTDTLSSFESFHFYIFDDMYDHDGVILHTILSCSMLVVSSLTYILTVVFCVFYFITIWYFVMWYLVLSTY